MDHHHHHQWLAATSSSSTARIEPLDQQQSSNNIGVIEREHMFDKVVTPSDVGKLNRLVIPKQYAEKYFPLNNNNNSSSEINGLLLNFEDSTGKSWRFRYSYWNSSQSYVMTKGWSRFVKDKKLDAGDIVSFQRGVGELQGDRLFIDFRRRPDLGPIRPTSLMLPYYHHHHQYRPPSSWSSPGGGGGNNQGFMLRSVSQYEQTRGDLWDQYYHRRIPAEFPPIIVRSHPVYHNTRPMIFLRPPSIAPSLLSRSGEGGGGPPLVQGKRLRLFGVNMDFPINNNNILNNQSGHHFDDSSSTTSSTIQVRTTNNSNNYDNSSSDPPHHSLQLRLCSNSDHRQLDKGKSSSSPSMSLDFDI